MKPSIRSATWLFAAVVICAGCGAEYSVDDDAAAPAIIEGAGELELNPIFGDNMVLQRGMSVPVWGTDAPGQLVSVTVAGSTASALAGDDGKWMARIDPLSAGGPYELIATGSGLVRVANVLVGEVWVCSGQSNMEWSTGGGRTTRSGSSPNRATTRYASWTCAPPGHSSRSTE